MTKQKNSLYDDDISDEKFFYIRPKNKSFDFYLSGPIGNSENYQNWFHTIRNAEPGDEVVIHINSPGGYLNTAIQLLQCINECQGTVSISVEGDCHSAATLIFLACDQYQLAPYSRFMIHNFSGGTFGKGNEMQAQVEFEKHWFSNVAKDLYKGFLTEEELNDVLRGVDIWLTTDEVHERMTKRNELMTLEKDALKEVEAHGDSDDTK